MRRFVVSLLAAAVLLPATAQAAAAEAPPPPGMETPAVEAPVEEAPVEEAPVAEAPVEEVPEEGTIPWWWAGWGVSEEEAPVAEAPVPEAPVNCLTAALQAWFDAEFAWIDARIAALQTQINVQIAARTTAIQVRSGLAGNYWAWVNTLEAWDAWERGFPGNLIHPYYIWGDRNTLVNNANGAGRLLAIQSAYIVGIENTIAALYGNVHLLEQYRTILDYLRAALSVATAIGEAFVNNVCPLFMPPPRPQEVPVP